MRVPDQHLSADEMELLGIEEGLSGELDDRLRSAREHAESCPACRRRLEVYPNTGDMLRKLRAPYQVQKGRDCPETDVWMKLAGGLLNDATRNRYSAHAAQCNHCGPVLREVANDFSEPVSEEEENLLSHPTDNAGKRFLAESMAPSPGFASAIPVKNAKLKARRWPPIPAWQIAFAALLVVCIGGALWFKFEGGRNDSVVIANSLLAQAYTAHRTMEVRIPEAKYGPIRVERGSAGSNLNRPPSLIKAEDLIAESLVKNPSDPGWLQARARADLLDGSYDSAIKTLEQALEEQPESPQLLTDLGSAYFLRAESANTRLDYRFAYNSFTKALAKLPDYPIALFNRALVGERSYCYKQAIADWEHYLSIDARGDWSDEARRRLVAIKGKVDRCDQSRAEPLLKPEKIAQFDFHGMAAAEKPVVVIDEILDNPSADRLRFPLLLP